ncbi:MAG: cupin domain-containing protein [Flavobacteriaceae bacterium]
MAMPEAAVNNMTVRRSGGQSPGGVIQFFTRSSMDRNTSRQAVIMKFRECAGETAAPGGWDDWAVNWIGAGANAAEGAVGADGMQVQMLRQSAYSEDIAPDDQDRFWIVLRGEIRCVDPEDGSVHRAGEMDCLHVPPGIGCRIESTAGGDVEFVRLQKPTAKSGGKTHDISIVRLEDLEPNRNGPRAREPGFVRWVTSWVGGPPGYVNFNRGAALVSENISTGLLELMPGSKVLPHHHQDGELYAVISGRLEVESGAIADVCVARDAAYFPAGAVHAVRNPGPEPTRVLWVYEVPQLEALGPR